MTETHILSKANRLHEIQTRDCDLLEQVNLSRTTEKPSDFFIQFLVDNRATSSSFDIVTSAIEQTA